MVKRASAVTGLAMLLASCGGSDPQPGPYGANPQLPEQQSGLLPSIKTAAVVGWDGGKPTVPAGFTVEAIATDLKVPRQTLVLPNGDILVAEGSGGGAPKLRPKDWISGWVRKNAKTPVKGGDRLTLLRDADGDGKYEGRTVFAEGLDAPYGLAFVNGAIYVANQAMLVRFPYTNGQMKAVGLPQKVTDLPGKPNHHWTKAMTASADGRYLYVGIGSNSNIGERGMAVEADRAVIWQIDPATGMHKVFAEGLRNPTALAVHPQGGALWTVVNERDELGPNLVPDYLTSVREGGFYGWPYSYWGQNVDPRIKPSDPKKVAAAIRPDYSLGSHVAPLGVAFSTPAFGPRFAEGVFIGQHGSWNRNDRVGYNVVFVPFRAGRPAGNPIEFRSGFLKDGKALGRPVGVTVDPRGALLVADDGGNIVWRIAPARPG